MVMFVSQAHARYVLGDLDFSEGRWTMVGVSLHNYHQMPIQKELGTFICHDKTVLEEMQQEWDFEEVFDDYCEYHYSLKFYKNGELQKTLRVNLLCNYITLGNLSYRFTMKEFLEHKYKYKKIKWSRIRFGDLDLLKVAVNELDNVPGVYWYGDVQQYNFKGSFMIGKENLPWNVNKDSLMAELTDQISAKLGREDFYIKLHCWYMSDDLERMSVRYKVYCQEDFFKAYNEEYSDVMTWWRNHFSEQSFVQIVVIGMNKKDYFTTMRDHLGY